MKSLLFSVALFATATSAAASTGRVSFGGAVFATTCTYHHDAFGDVSRGADCGKGIIPVVAAPAMDPDPATMDLLGMNLPTWGFTYH
jgi:hypothetical protein